MVIKMKVFLSYKWEDRESANRINGLLNNPNNRYRHLTEREQQDQRNKGEIAVKNYLKGIISECSALLCLVGNDTQNASGVRYELEVARSLGKKIVAVRIPNTTGGLPSLLRSWGISETKWNAKNINDALSR
ncbi:hypothetical protein ES703_71614 [subsurface metagenome]